MGLIVGVVCYGAVLLKTPLGYDDSLDAFGVHAIGGAVGAILTGVFIDASLGGVGLDKGVTMAAQVGKQFMGVGATVGYDLIVSLVLLKIIDAVIGLRVTEEEETEGLDIVLHDERGYNL